jgi:hypothetical protein
LLFRLSLSQPTLPPTSLYWHFPSDAAALTLSRHSKLKDSVEGMKTRAAAEETVVAREMVGREDTVSFGARARVLAGRKWRK